MHYTIKNIAGIEVIFAPMQDVSSTTVEIVVKAGSVYETKETNGLSHFLEHMFFKGGKTYKTAQAVVETMDALGGEFNAFTGNDYAGYYVKASPNHVFTALSVLGDMMVHATFPKEEIEKEKGVVIQEINMYNDRPDAKIAEIWDRSYFGDNSFGRAIIGPEDNVRRFTQDDVFAHKHALYTKDNLIITIAGRIDDEEAISNHIQEIFAPLPRTTTLARPSYTAHHPHNTRDFTEQKTNQNHLVYGGPGYKHDAAHTYAAKLLANIIGGTMSSRLFQEVREKRGLCYYIGCSHAAHPDYGTFTIRAGLAKEHYDEGIKTIQDVLIAAASSDITADELAKAQGNIFGKIQMGIETSDQMADFIGSQYLLYKKIVTLEGLLALYDAVTLSDIHTIAPLLRPENFYGCTIR